MRQPVDGCKRLRLDSFVTVNAINTVLHVRLRMEGHGKTSLGLLKGEDPGNRIEVQFDSDTRPYLNLRSWEDRVETVVAAAEPTAYLATSVDLGLAKQGAKYSLYVSDVLQGTASNTGVGDTDLRPFTGEESCLASSGFVDTRIDLFELLLDQDGNGLADLSEALDTTRPPGIQDSRSRN